MKKFAIIPAATLIAVLAAPAFAAGTPAAATAALASTAVAASSVSQVTISNNASRSRAQVHAEAVEFVKNHKTALAIQLEQYKN